MLATALLPFICFGKSSLKVVCAISHFSIVGTSFFTAMESASRNDKQRVQTLSEMLGSHPELIFEKCWKCQKWLKNDFLAFPLSCSRLTLSDFRILLTYERYMHNRFPREQELHSSQTDRSKNHSKWSALHLTFRWSGRYFSPPRRMLRAIFTATESASHH